MTPRIGFVGDTRDLLGESPVWDGAVGALFWVDSVGCKIRCHDFASGAQRSWDTPGPIGSIGLAATGHLVAAMGDGFHDFDLATGIFTPICRPEAGNDAVRFNDGKADRNGRFLAGTLETSHAEVPAGRLWRLDADGGCAIVESGIAIANALCFSPDGTRMYFADSLQGVVWVYDYDLATGVAHGRRVLADTREAGSLPDGATVDAEGCIWVALVQNSGVARYAPDGRLDRVVDLPIPFPTCPAFGGPALDILYVASASNSGRYLVTDHKDGGRMMAVHDLGTAGLPEARRES